MPMPLSLNLVKTLCIQVLEAVPHKTVGNTNVREWQAWQQGLASFRELLGSCARPDEQARLVSDPGLWQVAIRCVGGMTHDQGPPRKGDWDNLPGELTEELARWQEAGLLDPVPASSTEWPVVALATVARRLGLAWDDLPQRLEDAFMANSPGACAGLLAMDAGLDVDAVMERSLQFPKDKCLGHRLFHADHEQASQVLKDRLGKRSVAVHDGNGQTPLFEAIHHPVRTGILLGLGADPNARNHDGALAEETMPGASETVLETHEVLQQHRNAEQAGRARRQMLARAAARTAHARLVSLGLWDEVLALEDVHHQGQVMGPVGYMLAVGSGRSQGPTLEQLSVLARLVGGRRGLALLAREGSLEKGLARAMVLATLASREDWAARKEPITRALATAIRKANPDQVLSHVIACPQASEPIVLARCLGPDGMVPMAHWDAAGDALDGLLTRMGQRMSHWNNPPQPRTGGGEISAWVHVLDMLEATIAQRGEPEPAERASWLPAMLMLAAVAPAGHSALGRAVEWLARGVEPAWPDPACQDKAHRWLAKAHPSLWAQVQSRHLDGTLEEATGPGATRRARM